MMNRARARVIGTILESLLSVRIRRRRRSHRSQFFARSPDDANPYGIAHWGRVWNVVSVQSSLSLSDGFEHCNW